MEKMGLSLKNKTNCSNVKETIKAIFLYLLIILIAYSPVLFSSKSLYPITYMGRSTTYLTSNEALMDNINYGGVYADGGASDWVEIPIVAAAAWNVDNGELPLWDTYNSLGMPIIDNNNGSTLAPFTWLLNFVNTEMVWNLMYLGRLFFMLLFTYLFLRELDLGFAPAFVGGVVFGFSGYVMMYLNIFFLHVDAFLPMLMWGTVRYHKKSGNKQWMVCALVVAAMCLGGNPQNLITCCCLAFIYYLYLLFKNEKLPLAFINKEKLKLLCSYFLCYVAGVLFTLGYWLSFFTLYSNCYSYHGNAGLQSKSMLELLGLIVPKGMFYAAYRNWLPYIGIVTLIMLFVNLRYKRGIKFHGEKVFFSIFIFVFLLKILGFPLINWIGRLPILNELSFTKYNSSLYFSIAVLAAFAINDALQKESYIRNMVQCVAIILLCIGTIAAVFLNSEKPEILGNYLMAAAIILSVGVVLLFIALLTNRSRLVIYIISVLACVELMSYPLAHKDVLAPKNVAFEEPAFIEALKSVREQEYDRIFCVGGLLMGNLSAIYKVQSIGGVSATPEIHYWNFMCELILNNQIDMQMVTSQSSAYDPSGKKYLDMLGVKYFLIDNDGVLDHPSLLPIYKENGVTIYHNEEAFDRTFTVHDVVFVENEEQSLSLMKEELDFSQTAVVEASTELADIEHLPDGAADTVEILDYNANSVKISCNMVSNGLLVLTDLYYPGWKVYVNGKQTEIVRTNDVARGVFLNQGANIVEFIYRPTPFWMGTAISLFTFAIVIVVMYFLSRRRRKDE